MDNLKNLLYEGPVKAAKKLLGWQLYVREPNGELVGGIIVETEAYHQSDAASHSYKGKTPRTEAMFGQPGRIYVYFTYGMHWCMNIVTGKAGEGSAVLIRAIKPTSGINIIRSRRKYPPEQQLTNGPAKVCQALGITGVDNGQEINKSKFILQPPKDSIGTIKITKRIGISKDTHRLWRFVLNSP